MNNLLLINLKDYAQARLIAKYCSKQTNYQISWQEDQQTERDNTTYENRKEKTNTDINCVWKMYPAILN